MYKLANYSSVAPDIVLLPDGSDAVFTLQHRFKMGLLKVVSLGFFRNGSLNKLIYNFTRLINVLILLKGIKRVKYF